MCDDRLVLSYGRVFVIICPVSQFVSPLRFILLNLKLSPDDKTSPCRRFTGCAKLKIVINPFCETPRWKHVIRGVLVVFGRDRDRTKESTYFIAGGI